MKNVIRSLIFVLSLVLSLSFFCCNTDGDNTNNNDKNDPTGGKVVAVQYRGTYKEVPPNSGIMTLHEKTMDYLTIGTPAWTVDNILWIVDGGGKPGEPREFGRFENDELIGEYVHFKKQD